MTAASSQIASDEFVDWTAGLREIDASGLRSIFEDDASAAADSSKALPPPARITRQIQRRRFVALDRVAAAVEHLGQLPAADETIHSTMTGSFDGWLLVPAVIKLAGCSVDWLGVSTLGFSRDNAESLFSRLDDGTIGSTTFLVSSYFRSVDKDVFACLHAGLNSRGQTCAVRRVHAKVVLFQFTDGRQFVIESSSNLRSCRNLEVFTLCQSAELLAFHRGWMTDLVQRGSDK